MQPGLIDRFGCHAMAAGLSLPQAHFADFEAAFLEAPTAMIAPEALHETIASDGQLPADALHIHTACALRDDRPWGQGFPEPQSAAPLDVRTWWPVGTPHPKQQPGVADWPTPGITLSARTPHTTTK